MAQLDTSLHARRSRVVAAGFALLVAGLVAAQVVLVGDWRVDDSYITFAFSKNLALGRGAIYSHDVRVEGYTNFLWMVLNAVPIGLCPDADPIWAARVLAFVFLAVLLWSVYELGKTLLPTSWAILPVVLLACWTDLSRAALSGLETVPHAALLSVGVLFYSREAVSQRRDSLWWFMLAALMRISSITHLAFVLSFEAAWCCTPRGMSVRSVARWALPPLLVFGAYFLWRWSYYGLPLPTTYYAKNLAAAREPLRGLQYLTDAVSDLGGYWVALPVTLAVVRHPDVRKGFLAALIAAEVATVVHVKGDWMPFNRFWIPIGGPLAVLFLVGLRELWVWAASRAKLPRRALEAGTAVVYMAVILHVDSHVVFTDEEAAKLRRAAREKTHTMRNLLANWRFLAAITRQPGDLLVTDYGGVVGYYTDASVIEMWGLCNREIALRGNIEGINPIFGKTCVACYAEFEPDYLHTKTPLVRDANAFANQTQVVRAVFQGPALDRVLDFERNYVTGRVLNRKGKRALFFLERRRPGRILATRRHSNGVYVDYPFEQQRQVDHSLNSEAR
ncbi:MAG: hypothetical protein QM778_18190 [Myxococcales bacterium]